MTSIRLSLDLIRLTSGLPDHAGSACPVCEGVLAIHQPDEQSPERLLGTCMECRSWFLIDEAGALMLRLPEAADLDEDRSSSRADVA
jgi:hypothetical protein